MEKYIMGIDPYYDEAGIKFPAYIVEESVNHPKHYGGEENIYEAIKVIEAWELGFSLGNAVKYIARAGKKNATTTVEDLNKAKWYIERRILELSKINT